MVRVVLAAIQDFRARRLADALDKEGHHWLSDGYRHRPSHDRFVWLLYHILGFGAWRDYSAEYRSTQSLPFDLLFYRGIVCFRSYVAAIFGAHLRES